MALRDPNKVSLARHRVAAVESQEGLDRVQEVLCEPARLRIIAALQGGELTVGSGSRHRAQDPGDVAAPAAAARAGVGPGPATWHGCLLSPADWASHRATPGSARGAGASPIDGKLTIMAANCGVLIVEDDDQIRAVFAEILSSEGFAVRTAANGRDALSLLQQWQPDLILLDLDMPDMDGRAFRAEQRRSPRLSGIPVIVMSAATLEVQVAELQAAETLAKPCDIDTLVTAIRRVINLSLEP